MGAGSQRFAAFFRAKASAHRQAPADAFRRGQNVGLNADGLPREQFAGAPDAGLHLVENQQNIALVTEFPRRFYVGFRGFQHAALALNDFHNHGANGFVEHFVKLLGVARVRVGKAFQKRGEKLVVMFLTRRGNRCDCAAVKGVYKAHDFIAPLAVMVETVFARKLNGALVGFGAGVAEQHAVEAGFFAKELCGFRDRLGVIEV